MHYLGLLSFVCATLANVITVELSGNFV